MFHQIPNKELEQNAIQMIADRWFLIAAGTKEKYNMMTGAWGALGEMWGKDIAAVVIRPTRYTYELMEENETFTISVLPEEINKVVHAVCGSQSGRDIDKTAATGLTPIFEESVYFEQAEIVLVCRKLYADDMKSENFIDKSLDEKWYHDDYHRLYVGEIIKTLVKK